MRVFNLAEELEKERKKSKILEENNKLLIQQKAKMYEDLDKLSNRIDKAIEYIEKKYYKKVYKTKGTSINDLLNILKDDRK